MTDADVLPADVQAAAERLKGVVRRTPVFTLPLDDGRPVTLKLEHLQATGSFKARGASNAIMSLDPGVRGVVAASGGNHGQAVAWAAARRGVDAVVVVPESSPDEKANRVASFGAKVVRHGSIYDEAETRAREIEEEEGRSFIHAFGNPLVIAGQGTVGLEMLEEAPGCDALVVAIGGGGLISGVGVAASGSSVPVVGAEPLGAPTLFEAVAAGGEPVTVEVDTITASSMGARRTTPLNARLVAKHVQTIVQLTDEEILRARDWLWENARIAVEVGGATGLAAVLSGKVDADHPCVLICGSNEAWIPAQM